MILGLKEGKLWDSGKEQEGKTCHNLHALRMNDDLWDRVRGLDSETWKECELVELVVFLKCLDIPDLLRAMSMKASVINGKISN